ncbi:hypothetical protein BCR44DRAFT_81675 [Catenaria anguillulae PL171]|uniref:Uncharacterized protein n=1 Tax=Catenaria anguillulae PL171 TaxID=765915 RepID=A0A1Y2GX07_9FUNG|nr:hypothetical protein BCR44DRAFT_81675 [Catenaria anguillulae PL171]
MHRRWVPSSFDRVHIRIDPMDDECPKSISWASQLSNLHISHSHAILGVPAGLEENNDDGIRRKWDLGYFEIDIPQRYNLDDGLPIKYERKAAGGFRELNMFWGGWYLNEGGVHVKVPENWNGSADEMVAAKVKLGVWGLEGEDFGPLEDTWMLNGHDIHELPSDIDSKTRTLIHLPTGLTTQAAQDNTDRESALISLLKRLYVHDKDIAGGRTCSGRGARHSPLTTRLTTSKSLASYDNQVVRMYSKDRNDDLVSGYRSSNPGKLFSGNSATRDMTVFHQVLLASLEHHALSSIQEVIKSLEAVAKAEETLKQVK